MEKNHTCDELIIGVCGGIGADLNTAIKQLADQFEQFGFTAVHIKVTEKIYKDELIDILTEKKDSKINKADLKNKNKLTRLNTKIDIGNSLCENFKLKSIHAQIITSIINSERNIINSKRIKNKKKENLGIVFIINQLKRPEEYHYLKKIYSRSFFLVGVFHDERKRIERLKYGEKENESEAIKLIRTDADEKHSYGQHLEKLFTEAHFIVDAGLRSSCKKEIIRFVELLFGYNFHTPTISESCMYLAKGVSARSADLSRQVGAVIADDNGNIISVGCNDVPKPGGGLYHAEDNVDLRDYSRGFDTNKREIKKIIESIVDHLKCSENHKPELDHELKDLLEYSRCVHAEEAAICDAAWRGVSLKGTTLYCTTFPCHLCAKHIMAAGIKEVIYVEPYQKSKVRDLFPETIALYQDEHNDSKLNFTHFTGVKPRTFRHVFSTNDPEGDRRKDNDGNAIDYGRDDKPELIYALRTLNSCFYLINEQCSIKTLPKEIKKLFDKQTNFSAPPINKVNSAEKKEFNLDEIVKGIENNIGSFLNYEKKRNDEQ